jgi:hypothetical protein
MGIKSKFLEAKKKLKKKKMEKIQKKFAKITGIFSGGAHATAEAEAAAL